MKTISRVMLVAAGLSLALGGVSVPANASASTIGPSLATPATLNSPGGVTTTSSATRITVNWKKVSGATGYKVRIRDASGTTLATKTVTALTHKFYGLNPQTEYRLAVATVNSKGTGSYSTAVKKKTKALAKPVQISTPSVSSVKDTSSTVTWSVVADVATYQVDILQGNSVIKSQTLKAVKNHNTLNDTKVTFTGLPQYKDLKARVRGINANGNGPWSTERTFKTLATKISVTDVKKPTVASVTTNSAQVSWRAVPYAHDYLVAVKLAGKTVRSWVSTGTSRKVDGLAAGTPYTVTVIARNTTSSVESEGANFITIPGKTSGVKAGYRDDRVVVTWNAVTGATSYVVTVLDGQGQRVASATVNNGALTKEFTGLPANQDLFVTVAAQNVSGVGVASDRVQVVLPPEAPRNISVSEVSLTGATISWATPRTPVIGHTVFIRQGDVVVSSASTSGNATSVRIEGLAWDTTYRVHVVATGAGGDSKPSASRSFNTKPPTRLKGEMKAKTVRTGKNKVQTTVNISVPGAEEASAYRPVNVRFTPLRNTSQSKMVTLKYNTSKKAYVGKVVFTTRTAGRLSLTGDYVSVPSITTSKIKTSLKVSKFKKTSKTLSGRIKVKNAKGTKVRVEKKVGFTWKRVASFKVKKNNQTFKLKRSAKKHAASRYWRVVVPTNDTASGTTVSLKTR